MGQTMQETKYEWDVDGDGASLTIFRNNIYLPGTLENIFRRIIGKPREVLPYLGRPKHENIAPHRIDLTRDINPDEYPSYIEDADSMLELSYCGENDSIPISAYFLDGMFIGGRFHEDNGARYSISFKLNKFKDLEDFRNSLTRYLLPTNGFGLPPFGEQIGEMIKNSNLPQEYLDSFRELTE
ncbi:hypothetical protein CMI42_02005 [Candidatus Pacearchaeota archaeon]|nr:hypothetical protein [Candidatus Pacearchaeota archaeon]|tara:strand:+ start:561 stop:1109 length:549 start_codon:yes stop_codon:yes gene_type:complete